MRSKILTAIVLVLLIITPFVAREIYLAYTSLPETVTIARGPAEGEWMDLSESLRESVDELENVSVEPSEEPTGGAMHHLQLLRDKEVDFAFYLRGAQRLRNEKPDLSLDSLRFVCNLYSDATLFLVRRDLYEAGTLRTPEDLLNGAENQPWQVAVGMESSGENSINTVVLDYFLGDANKAAVDRLELDYNEVEEGFRDRTLHAAFITAGHQAPIFKYLLEATGLCQLGQIPELDAIVMKNVGLDKTTIPSGLYRYQNQPLLDEDLETIAAQTTLLTHEDVPSQMVEKVLEIVLSEEFIRENQLYELSREGTSYARRKPEFEPHDGALAYYEPHMKPLIDPEFIDASENLRSFAVSLLVAGFLVYQWGRRRSERQKEHRLDHYFSMLLEIDRRALAGLDHGEDVRRLQDTLARVTALRNDALKEFSAKDFDEDSAADSFLQLCDTVASGVHSRMLRWQLQQSVVALTDEIRGRGGSSPEE